MRLLIGALALLAACEPHAVVGAYSDAGHRCDPLGTDCQPQSCLLARNPDDDACKPAGTLAIAASCTALDSCVAQAQCAVIEGDALIDAARVASGGRCLRVCARDAVPACSGSETCHRVRTADGNVRLDYGLCAP